jgi:phenylpyruvate tautomerase PptA (4-oxalocrotonate tautomerase family)
MPLIHLSYPEGTFTAEQLNAAATELTKAGLETEGIPLTEFNLSTTWIFARPYPPHQVFSAGKPVKNNFIAVEINALVGGHSNVTKATLIKRATDIISAHAAVPKGEPRRIYVLVRELPESSWGFDGNVIDLELLRAPVPDAKPL